MAVSKHNYCHSIKPAIEQNLIYDESLLEAKTPVQRVLEEPDAAGVFAFQAFVGTRGHCMAFLKRCNCKGNIKLWAS